MKLRNSKMKKWIAGIICGAMFIAGAGNLTVNAEEAVSAKIDGVYLEDEKIALYINHNQGEEWQIDSNNSLVTIDDQACDIENIEMLKNTEIPVSYVCMVDISGSMSKESMDSVKSILNQFVDGKNEQDNFYITKMGNHLSSSEVLQNSDEIKEFIEGIEVTKEDTNLYQSIKDELSMMEKQQSLHQKKCLIIFSDGADDHITGITREEAEDAVKESDIPIFTVAMVKENPTETQKESAKVLGSFARYSKGGQHYAPGIEEYGSEEVYGKVQTVLNSSLIVTTSIENVIITGDSAEIEVTLSDGTVAVAAEEKIAGDIVKNIKILNTPEETEEQESTEVEETGESVAETEPENGLNLVVILVLAGIIVCGIAVAVIVIKRRKKKLDDDIEYAKKADVSLVQTSGNEEQYNFTIKEEIKIGRGRRCHLCLKDDAALSEVHCSLQWKQGELFAKDENSTNGTYINGVPIVGEYKLEQGDVMLIGSYEYRISWR